MARPRLNKAFAKHAVLTLRLNDQVKRALERAAAEDARSMSSYVLALLQTHLRQQGYLGDLRRTR